jgi:hypothetical protein
MFRIITALVAITTFFSSSARAGEFGEAGGGVCDKGSGTIETSLGVISPTMKMVSPGITIPPEISAFYGIWNAPKWTVLNESNTLSVLVTAHPRASG